MKTSHIIKGKKIVKEKLLRQIRDVSKELYTICMNKDEEETTLMLKDSIESKYTQLSLTNNAELLTLIFNYFNEALDKVRNEESLTNVSAFKALVCLILEGFYYEDFFENNNSVCLFIKKASLSYELNDLTLKMGQLLEKKKKLIKLKDNTRIELYFVITEIENKSNKIQMILDEIRSIDFITGKIKTYEVRTGKFVTQKVEKKTRLIERKSLRRKERLNSYFMHDGSLYDNNSDLEPDATDELDSVLFEDLEDKSDEIQFSIVSPRRVNRGEINELFFIMFEEEYQNVIEDIVRKSETDTNVVVSDKYVVDKGQYRIVMTSFDGSKEEECINWQGKYKKCCFNLEIPKTYLDDEVIINFDVYKDNSIRIVNLKCRIYINKNGKFFVEKNKVKRVFLSYSRKDLKEVLRIRQGMEALCIGKEIFLDIIDLVENSDWESVIRKQIDSSDLFFLIWSKNSSAVGEEKTGVQKEYEHALNISFSKPDDFFQIINLDNIPIPNYLAINNNKAAHSKLNAFISYSKENNDDKKAISQILLGMRSLCIGNGIDLKTMNYDEGINKPVLEIDKSDILYLMLSKSSTNDINVEKEYNYAIEKYGIDFVFVIPLEKAENIKIPTVLSKKHLNSTIVYIIDGLK